MQIIKVLNNSVSAVFGSGKDLKGSYGQKDAILSLPIQGCSKITNIYVSEDGQLVLQYEKKD